MSARSSGPSEAARHEPQHIGYAECVDLPEWGISALRAKADTGARTSALHVDSIEPLSGGRVRFEVVLNRKAERRVQVVSKITRYAQVRSSSGASEKRYFVSVLIRIGSISKRIEVSLAARHTMQFRMLLGRSALAHDFVIDPGRRYLTGRRPTRRVRKRSAKSKRASKSTHERERRK